MDTLHIYPAFATINFYQAEFYMHDETVNQIEDVKFVLYSYNISVIVGSVIQKPKINLSSISIGHLFTINIFLSHLTKMF